MYDMIQLNSAI